MYVVLEGIDTTGKSTQIELLKSRYKDAIFTKEPSDSECGNLIREIALYEALDNTAQALLFMIDRAKHTQEIIYPNKDKLIISDRSFISGIAYCDTIDFDWLCKLNLSIAYKPEYPNTSKIIMLIYGIAFSIKDASATFEIYITCDSTAVFLLFQSLINSARTLRSDVDP